MTHGELKHHVEELLQNLPTLFETPQVYIQRGDEGHPRRRVAVTLPDRQFAIRFPSLGDFDWFNITPEDVETLEIAVADEQGPDSVFELVLFTELGQRLREMLQ